MLLSEQKLWIILADVTEAKIYAHYPEDNSFKLHAEFSHPEGRLKVHDLVTDHPGHYGAGSASGAFSQDHNPKDNENTRFAKELTDFLDHARATNEFDKLVVVMLPHFYGLFEKHLSSELQKTIAHHVMKDYLHLPAKELHKVLEGLEKT